MTPNMVVVTMFVLSSFVILGSNAQLSTTFYSTSCPNVSTIVRELITQELGNDARLAASLIRLHFHDCFVDGCDGSVLLDDSSSIDSEKNAVPNAGSIRRTDFVDTVKTAVENVCPGIVSCADILTIAAEISVELSNGPSWSVQLGRRDGTTANRAAAENLPSPFENITILRSKFSDLNLDDTDLVALSGAHTFGRAQCTFITARLYNFNGTGSPDESLDATYRAQLEQQCPQGGSGTALVNLDPTTPNGFDNAYFTNLREGRGLLSSDQLLYSGEGAPRNIVERFAGSQTAFFEAFVQSMTNMGNLSPLTGTSGEIRTVCTRVNGA